MSTPKTYHGYPCKSGRHGWAGEFRNSYRNFEEFIAFENYYGLSKRLGFKTPEELWEKNPIVCGSTHPDDLAVVDTSSEKWKEFVANYS